MIDEEDEVINYFTPVKVAELLSQISSGNGVLDELHSSSFFNTPFSRNKKSPVGTGFRSDPSGALREVARIIGQSKKSNGQ
ncbi:hypothetical protein [Prolixibacter sp. SD074]|uniref:hypothetical protein n=1 Tax=Prolixibacter sp. SD074 TaxID=2652391 RepID=UPI0012842F67|nr:hypothetical protein [Prolixibacter sp. SD074]GET29379.1 hypothetical protein SD074_15810 [Prolixibacter sp. SD074]